MTIDPRGAIQSGLGALEQLEMKVPGFKGYKEKELRRQSDRVLREALVRQYQEQKNRIGEAESTLLTSGQLSGMSRIETANLKLNLLIDHLKTGASGYAGLFDAIKVKEPQLDRVYTFDQQLAGGVEKLKGIIDQIGTMSAQGTDPGPVVNGLVAAIEELNTTWLHRVDAMQGLAA